MDVFQYGQATLYRADCLKWLAEQPPESIHACVTDPPYGLVEYSDAQQAKLRAGRGGVWRIPPSFDGHRRSPLPRFTTLTAPDLEALGRYFTDWGSALLPVLVPGAYVVVASQSGVSDIVSVALREAGLERRGEIIRLVQTLRGGDRPKNAHLEFPEITSMPRGRWEPWLLFRKPFAGTLADNLRRWGTGGVRRLSAAQPFADVISSGPTPTGERRLAPHPSLKPQAFLRPVVRAMLPRGEGVVLDPFAGAGSTLAAAEAVGYASIGVELDPRYAGLAATAIPALARLVV
jgi:site-specific DNA-methyltransferase (adenine-specific)